jgi:tripartite-type tricarboxylate transporter receptor subunit TctC
MRISSSISGVVVAFSALSVFAAAAQAQSGAWPNRPIRIIVPFTPGGLQDLDARGLGAFMEPHLKTPVVVENRPGAGAAIGIEAVAKAAADGYTLLLTGASISQLNFLRKGLTFDATKDLIPISQITEGITTIVTNKQSPFRTWQEMVAYAKANPGKLNFGGLGVSSVGIAWQSLTKSIGIDVPEIPYGGQSAYETALLRNDVQMIMGINFKPRVDSGDIVPLVAIGGKRHPHFPNVPTTDELGYGKAIRSFAWTGFFAPTGTPKPIIDRLSFEAANYAKDPDAVRRATAAGNVLVGSSSADFKKTFDNDTQVWGAVAKAINLQPQ